MIRHCLILLAALVSVAPAIAATPSVESISPGVGQRGSQFTLTFTGARLSEPQELLFYSSGITCIKLEAKDENSLTATLRADEKCSLGEHPFRLRTVGGISELRTLRITPFPVVLEVEPNDEPRQAHTISGTVSIAAICESAGFDHYRVTLKKGERLSAEVEGIRLGAELTDTLLTVIGADGKEMVTVDDTPMYHQDPFVSFIAPVDGDYLIRVRDTNFGGGGSNRYILHLGNFSRPDAVYPAGGEAGNTIKLKLFGGLAGDWNETVSLPRNQIFHYFPSDGKIASPTEVPFRVSPFPNVLEVEPNGDVNQATPSPVGWPIAFNGIIEKPGDVDHFHFAAKKGDRIDVNAFAFRIGSPLDSVVSVLSAKGDLIARGDDTETHDSHFQVTIPSDGDYVVRVEDKRKQGGERFIYRVELDRPRPSMILFLPTPTRKSHDHEAISIPRGNRVSAFLAVRRDGFTGPITISPHDLPKGVTLTLSTIPADEYLIPVTFEAAKDAPLGGGLIRLTGSSSQVSPPVNGEFSQVVRMIHGPGESSFHTVNLSQLAICVIEEAPFSLSVSTPKTAIPRDGTLDLTLKVNRAKDFPEPIEVSFPSLPPGVETPTSVIIPSDRSEATVTLSAQRTADVGEWKLLAEGKIARPSRANRDPAAIGGGMMGGTGTPRNRNRKSAELATPVASELVTVITSEAPIRGKFLPAAAEQGKMVKVTLQLDTDLPPNAMLTAKLDGLPPRATAPTVEVKRDSRNIAFEVKVDPTTPIGTHASLIAELSGMVEGQRLVYRVGRVGTLKVDAVGGVKTDATGKPLSPLEALRLESKKNESKK